jgi:transcriptional regulator with XRE-family HTH domain
MALFFDATWFDAKLQSLGLTRATVGAALGLDDGQLGEVWKDQRELSVKDVRVLAALLGSSGEEIADRAGVSTPVPPPDVPSLQDMAQRLDRIERALAELTALVKARG